MDQADAGAVGVGHVPEIRRGPVDADLARVRPVDPAEHLDEGRLAGPVLAEQGVDLAGAQVEVDPVECPDAAEGLADPAQLQERRKVKGHRPSLG